MLNLTLLLLGGYFIAVLVCTHLFSRRIQNLKDFFLAGRRLGSLPAALALIASWFGASSTLGSINAFHNEGVSGVWHLILPSLLSFLIITFVMAKPVAKQNFLSQPEAVEAHYGKTGRFLLSLVILSATVAFIASQLIAAAMVYKMLFGISTLPAMLISILTVLSYATWGGYYAVVITDIAQVLFVVLGFGTLLYFAWTKAIPNPQAWQHFLIAHPSGFWNWTHHWKQNIFLVITFVLGWSIAPEMWQRMSSTRSPQLAFRAGWQASLIMAGMFTLVASIGLLSTQIIPQHHESVLIALALAIPSPFLKALVLLGFISAVTSTMDSAINIGSLTLTRDLVQGFINPKISDAACIWIGRLSTIVMVIPALAVALYFQDIIKTLWISADIYACCMFWPIIGILYLKNPGRLSGLLGMLSGGIVVLLNACFQSKLFPWPSFWPLWPCSTLLGVALSGLGYGIGFWLSHLKDRELELPNQGQGAMQDG
jgi:solute:Na+ symporter, SSS family